MIVFGLGITRYRMCYVVACWTCLVCGEDVCRISFGAHHEKVSGHFSIWLVCYYFVLCPTSESTWSVKLSVGSVITCHASFFAKNSTWQFLPTANNNYAAGMSGGWASLHYLVMIRVENLWPNSINGKYLLFSELFVCVCAHACTRVCNVYDCMLMNSRLCLW